MRIVILSSSVYGETACALAVRLAELGHIPVGALCLQTLDRGTILRKLGQLGVGGVFRYARRKVFPRTRRAQVQCNRVECNKVQGDNRYLAPWLSNGIKSFRTLHEVAAFYAFPVATCENQNAANSVAQLAAWTPDLIIFSGGNILRKPVLDVPRLGVLNIHLGLLPQIRGMSSPEWSLLNNIAVGVTLHYIDEGIDTGPVLQRSELHDVGNCESIDDLRHRLIACGVEKIGGVITALSRGKISATPQSELRGNRGGGIRNEDSQFFVMHEWLRAQAEDCLENRKMATSHPLASSINK